MDVLEPESTVPEADTSEEDIVVPEVDEREVPEYEDEARIARAEAPADMPPPVFTPVTEPAESAEAGADLAEEAELDPRALKALSRQERRDAKAAHRREQAEARNAARQAKAQAKAAAKAGLTAPVAGVVLDDGEVIDAPEVEAEWADEATAEIPAVADDVLAAPDAPETPVVASDPRARAAARVQRRLGKDADKLSAAEARAKAREEARRRRAQAKELRSGVVAAEEPVMREADDDVEPIVEQTVIVEPILDEPVVDEPVLEELELDETALIEPVVDEDKQPEADDVEDEVVHEEEMARPSLADRIDEPAPVDEPVEEDTVADEPLIEEPSELPARVEVQRKPEPVVPTTLPMDGEERPKRPSQLGPIAGVVGLVALGISVLLAIGALLVALGFDSGGLYSGLKAVADTLVGPLKSAFDFDGANAERKEHFLAWGAGSIGYLVISFIGQAVQRANTDDA